MQKLLKKILNIPSVSSDIKELNNIIKIVKEEFENYDCNIITIEHNKKPSILIQNFKGKKADILFSGHLDVVPPSQEDQFNPFEKNGKIFCRGAGDMKSGCVIMIKLMQSLLKENYKKRKISLMLTTDEEVGGLDGTNKFVQNGYTGKIVIIPDGGSTDSIVYAEKGIYEIQLSAKGKSCHSARPWLGENALQKIINCTSSIKEEFEDIQEIKNHRRTTVNINNITTGTDVFNLIPDYATAKIDIRFTEDYNINIIKETIENITKSFDCSIEQIVKGNLLFTNPNIDILQKYKKITSQVLGKNVILEKEHGASDGRFFVGSGTETIILHRPKCGNLHGKDERVQKDDINKIYECFYKFVKDI